MFESFGLDATAQVEADINGTLTGMSLEAYTGKEMAGLHIKDQLLASIGAILIEPMQGV